MRVDASPKKSALRPSESANDAAIKLLCLPPRNDSFDAIQESGFAEETSGKFFDQGGRSQDVVAHQGQYLPSNTKLQSLAV